MSDPVTLRSLAEHGAVDRSRLVGAASLGVASALTALVVPWLAGAGLTELFEGSDALLLLLAAIVGALAFRLAFEFGAVLLTGAQRFDVVANLRRHWHARILAVPPGGERDSRRQQWVSILSYDIPRVAEVLVDLPVSLVRAVITLVGALVAMGIISLPLTVVVAAGAPLAYFGARALAGRMRALAAEYWNVEIDAMTRAEEAFRARRIVHAFGQQARLQSSFADAAERASTAGVAHLKLLAFIGPATQFVSFCGIVGVVWLGTSLFSVALEPGALLSFVLYGLLLSQPLRAFADGWSAYHEASATLERFAGVPGPLQFGERDTPPDSFDIVVEDVSFAWDDEPVLTGATLEIRHREHVAIMGANGAGKSTLVSLLLGFARPSSGQIRIGGVDLADLTLDARRRLFSVVPQDELLIRGTVRENVAFSRPNADDETVHAALDAALATEFVDALPDGLDTMVREEGGNLSGGQRQRLALARALLVDAPIVILDEAASGYDPEGRAEVVRRCRDELRDRTVIWITHDDARLDHVDRRIELADGRFSGVSEVLDETAS